MSGRTGAGEGRLAGKTALIAGATSGIGRATAAVFAREGAKVLACGRSRAAGHETHRLAAAAAGPGGACVFHPLDVTQETQWRQAVDACIARWGRLDILVNSAVRVWMKPIADTSLAEFDALYRTNVEGAWLGMKTVMPEMEKCGGGAIVTVSCRMGQVGVPAAVAYCATDGALAAMTKSAAIEGAMAGRRIRVNRLLHPGGVRPQMVAGAMGQVGLLSEAPPGDAMLLGRARAQDIADAILFLACDESSYMTGADLAVDGGRGPD